MFEEEGLVASGYFEGDKLARHRQLENSATNFMALRGKYTVSSKGVRYIGEHNRAGSLQGQGIRIDKNGTYHIGYFDQGEFAPGKFIQGNDSDLKSLRVGEYKLNEQGKAEKSNYELIERGESYRFAKENHEIHDEVLQ